MAALTTTVAMPRMVIDDDEAFCSTSAP